MPGRAIDEPGPDARALEPPTPEPID